MSFARVFGEQQFRSRAIEIRQLHSQHLHVALGGRVGTESRAVCAPGAAPNFGCGQAFSLEPEVPATIPAALTLACSFRERPKLAPGLHNTCDWCRRRWRENDIRVR